MPKFYPTKENQVRDNGYTELVLSSEGNTKEWYVNTYFGGIDNLIKNFEKVPSVNPLSGGDDYNITITFKNPTELFGIEYKTIKWFASDVMFQNYFVDDLNDIEKVSYWFVKNTKTRWVNGVPVVKFSLTIDLLATFSNYIEKLSGQFYFKRKHFDRWKIGLLNDKKDKLTNNSALFPNLIDAPSIKNCNTFCQNKTSKYMKSANVENSESFVPVAIIYYDLPLQDSEPVGGLQKETLINYNDTNVSIPYGIAVIKNPNEKGENQYVSKLISTINFLQSGSTSSPTRNAVKIVSVSYSSFKTDIWEKIESEWKNISSFSFIPPHWNGNKLGIGQSDIGYIDKDITEYEIWYSDADKLFTKELKDLIVDEILPKNEPHLGMANHRELHLSTPDKKSQILDYSLMFLNGNPFKTDNEKILIKTKWWEIFDVSYGGKYGYIDNTSTTLEASLWNDRNFIDYSGSVDFPYKTDSYLEAMQTQLNQKKAAYDNINIEKQTGETIRKINNQQNDVNMLSDFTQNAANILSDSGDWLGDITGSSEKAMFRDTAKMVADFARDSAKTIADRQRDQANIDNKYKQSKNTTDAKYADLANSPSNIHNSGKISGNSMLIKSAIGGKSKFIYDMRWYVNDIVDIEKYQIAFDFNRYGYTCDWISDNRKLTDFLTRRFWDYVEIINAGELLRNINLDPVILNVIADCFKNGITIFRAETHNKPIVIDYNSHNYELSLLDSFRLDYVFDTLLL